MKSFSAQAGSRLAHRAAIGAMALFVVIATGVGFAQSWAGLYGWATGHGLTGWKADTFPAMVDLFILVGELALFTLSLEGVSRKSGWASYLLPTLVTVAGWTVSLVFNVGHADHDPADQFTAAVPPVASMVGLFLLLQTLHRQVVRANTAEPSALEVAPPIPAAKVTVEREPTAVVSTPAKVADESFSKALSAPPEGDKVGQADVVEQAPPARRTTARAKKASATKPPARRKRAAAPATARVLELHEAGVSPREIAIRLDTTRYQVDKALSASRVPLPGQLEIAG